MKFMSHLLVVLMTGQIMFADSDPNEHASIKYKSTKWILESNVFDAGKVKEAHTIRTEFIFYNSSDIPVKITNSAPSCSCLMSPDIIDQEVQPGDGFIIPLEAHAEGSGLVDVSIDFKVLPLKEKFTLYMRCQIIETIKILPEKIGFGNYLEGEVPNVNRSLKVINFDDSIEELNVKIIEPKNDYLSVKQIGETQQLISKEDKKLFLSEFDVNCVIDHLLPGKYDGMIEIKENHNMGSILLQIPYNFKIVPTYTIMPSDLLLFQKSDKMNFIEKEIVIKRNKPSKYTISKIRERSKTGVMVGKIESLGRDRSKVFLLFPVSSEFTNKQKLIFEIYEEDDQKPKLAELNVTFKRMHPRRESKSLPYEYIKKENSKLITNAIQEYRKRTLSLEDGPWITFHSLLVNGKNLPLQISSNENKRTITFNEYLCLDNSDIGGWKNDFIDVDFASNKYSFLHGNRKRFYEGHAGQFLMILALAGFTKNDCIFHESSGRNIALKLLFSKLKSEITLMHNASWFLCLMSLWGDGKDTWQNKYGETLSMDILTTNHIGANFQQPFDDDRMPCLGTHAVFGLAYALSYREKNGLTESTFKLGQDTMIDLFRRAELSMSSNGSFNINWLDGMEINDSDLSIDLQLNHQGHMLEWITYAASDSQLESQKWIHVAVNYYATQLNNENFKELSYGPLSHGIRALIQYQKRIQVRRL